MSKHTMNFGHRMGKKMAAEMAGEKPVMKARGGKVGMPHIGARTGIVKPVKIAAVKAKTPAPMTPQGIAVASMPAEPLAEKKLPAYARGGPVKKTIHINPANKGKLHATLKVPAGEKIPEKKLMAAKNSSNPVTRKRAQFAINAKSFSHKAKGGKVKEKC